MALTVTIESVGELDTKSRATIEAEYGALEDVDFIVYWYKCRDDEYGDSWRGWPFMYDGRIDPVRVDDPNNWKNTWFIFRH